MELIIHTLSITYFVGVAILLWQSQTTYRSVQDPGGLLITEIKQYIYVRLFSRTNYILQPTMYMCTDNESLSRTYEERMTHSMGIYFPKH